MEGAKRYNEAGEKEVQRVEKEEEEGNELGERVKQQQGNDYLGGLYKITGTCIPREGQIKSKVAYRE